MSIFKHNLSKKTKVKLLVGIIVIAILLIYSIFDIINHGPLTQLLSEKDKFVRFVQELGFLGPLVFVFLQILQALVAPLPGQISGIAGGVLFGWWGILWTAIGTFLGYWLIFWLSRKFGRELVEKIIKKSSLEKFDKLTKQKGSLVFFLFFLIPGLPDDIIGYIAGLTEIPIRQLLAMAMVGRFPAIVAANMIGTGINNDSVSMVLVTGIISAILIVIVFLKSEQIFAWLNKSGKK